MRRTPENSALLAWAIDFWRDCGLEPEVFDSRCTPDDALNARASLTVRVRDRDTGILWRFEISPEYVVRDSVSAHNHVIAFFEEQELRIRQATFYVRHCREILRVVQQERHERYMRALGAQQPWGLA